MGQSVWPTPKAGEKAVWGGEGGEDNCKRGGVAEQLLNCIKERKES